MQREAGAEVTVMTADQVDANALSYSAIAFGCPAMGSEVLEEVDFQPMFDGCKNRLGGTSVALFGSYGWGDGEWMRRRKGLQRRRRESGVRKRYLLRSSRRRCSGRLPRRLGKALAK